MANDEQPWEVEADDSPPAAIVLEACCDSRESVRNAVKGGARRVEICARSSLHVGGLTPSPALVRAALGDAGLPGRAMDIKVTTAMLNRIANNLSLPQPLRARDSQRHDTFGVIQ